MTEPSRTKWSIMSLVFFLVMSAHHPTLAVVSEVLDEVAALLRELTR